MSFAPWATLHVMKYEDLTFYCLPLLGFHMHATVSNVSSITNVEPPLFSGVYGNVTPFSPQDKKDVKEIFQCPLFSGVHDNVFPLS